MAWLNDGEGGAKLSDFAVTQRVALVTGAARRIGATIAEAIAKRGISVVVHSSARSAGDAETLVRRLSSEGAQAAIVTCDLADSSATQALIAQAGKHFGPVDILVNSASIFAADTIDTLDPAAFDRHAAVNLRAPLILARAFAEQADASRDPTIINLLDQRVFAPNPCYLSYTLSKAGLAAATTILAQSLAPKIRVNAVAPGPVLPNANDGSERFEAEVAEVPLARAVPLKAIAEAVLYLVSARNVTGQTIAVDSGQRLAWRTPDVLASFDED